jgi:hypothetical protein
LNCHRPLPIRVHTTVNEATNGLQWNGVGTLLDGKALQ